jgi:hypothetical protein
MEDFWGLKKERMFSWPKGQVPSEQLARRAKPRSKIEKPGLLIERSQDDFRISEHEASR